MEITKCLKAIPKWKDSKNYNETKQNKPQRNDSEKPLTNYKKEYRPQNRTDKRRRNRA